jgi:hypothetical protein
MNGEDNKSLERGNNAIPIIKVSSEEELVS